MSLELKVAFACKVDDLVVPIWPYQLFNASQSDRRSEANTASENHITGKSSKPPWSAEVNDS